MNTRKLSTAIEVLDLLSQLSHCKRAQTAAIIVPDNFSRIDAIGYNGPPRGIANTSCTGEEGACGCVHAEANALIKVRSWERNLTMICLTSPCPTCAGLIINSGIINRVLCTRSYRLDQGPSLLIQAGIEYDILS